MFVFGGGRVIPSFVLAVVVGSSQVEGVVVVDSLAFFDWGSYVEETSFVSVEGGGGMRT